MSRRARASLSVAAVALVAAGGLQPSAASPHDREGDARPDNVVIIVVDSLSKEIVEKYDMDNVQELMADGVDTPRGYLGHLGSVTVVTHNVITSGQLPKRMGWTDEGYRDGPDLSPHDVLPDFKPANAGDDLFITSAWTKDQMFAVQNHYNYPKLADYLHAADPGSKVFTVSPKGYAAWAFGGPGSDSIITFGSTTTCPDTDPLTVDTYRGPTGSNSVNVPSYLAEPCGRFFVHHGYPTFAYDTTELPAILYPLDGDRYTTGKDPEREGGDVWAADAAIEIMRNEADWSGIFVSLPGVDKAAHMWGGVLDDGGTDPMTHMEFATAEADEQVDRIMTELEAQGELDNTLVVLTSDHGSVAGKSFHGELVAERDYGYYNWYYGDVENDPTNYNRPQDALRPLVDTGNVGLTYSDSMLRVWLRDQAPAKVTEAAAIMEQMPGVSAVWVRTGDRFDRASPVRWDRMSSGAEKSWFARHAQELVDTEAADFGPDVIATLVDHTTYSVAGDHGGIQRHTQQVPIVFAGGGVSSRDLRAPVRSVDIMPTILRRMGIPATYPMDGIAYPLPTAGR